MFQFPGFASYPLWIQGQIPVSAAVRPPPSEPPAKPPPVQGKDRTGPGHLPAPPGSWTAINCSCQVGSPIRKSTDQSPFPAPRGLSQGITSFIASCCQGIRQTPFSRLIRPGTGTARSSRRASRRIDQHVLPMPRTRWFVGPRGGQCTRLGTAPPSHGTSPCRCPATAGHRRCRCFSLNDVNSSPKAGRQTTRATSPVCRVPQKIGGAYRDRTDDLMLAKHALSQLS